MKERIKSNLILSVSSFIITLSLLIITIFAWYVKNDTASASGMMATTDHDSVIHLQDVVKAVRHDLTGNVITDTYQRTSSGLLYLVKREETDNSGAQPVTTTSNYTINDGIGFNINQMLPGEYVDITFGYYLTTGSDDRNYLVRLDNVRGQSFVVDDKTHYSTGVFKYAPLSLKTEAGTYLFDNSSSLSYTWFNSYSISANDTDSSSHVLLNHSWQDSYENLYFTFRVSEDFTQYYSLIGQASGSYGALLSTLTFTIGDIVFMAI